MVVLQVFLKKKKKKKKRRKEEKIGPSIKVQLINGMPCKTNQLISHGSYFGILYDKK
jgi:hypothetical protein